MKKGIDFFLIVVFICSCQSGKRVFNGIDKIYSKGILYVSNQHGKEYFWFIECKDIIDTVDILNNVFNANIDTGIMLNYNEPIRKFVTDHQNDMINYQLEDGKKIKAILIELIYSDWDEWPKSNDRIVKNILFISGQKILINFINAHFVIHEIKNY